MKKVYCFIVILLFIQTYVSAQNPDKISLRCIYSESYKFYSNKDKIYQDEMALNIGERSSEFYSWWARKRREVVDSLSAKGASLGEIIRDIRLEQFK